MDITKQNGNIAFNEEYHRYWNVKNPEVKFISVTTLIDKFVQPYDKDFWSSYKALEKLISPDEWKIVGKHLRDTKKIPKDILSIYDITQNDFNRELQAILDAWQEENRLSCERGTAIHADLENSFYLGGKNVELGKFGIGGKFECRKNYMELDLEYGVYPEYLIHRSSDDGILNLAGLVDLIIKQGNEITIVDHKGLPLDTPILTANGWSTMKDLKVGDLVFDKDGNLCNITVKSGVHYNPCYKIKFDNAESIVCDADHRWLISFRLLRPTKRNPDGYKHQVMTTDEIKAYLDATEKRTSSNIPKILNAKPLNTKKTNLPLDPYVLGAWLGDGSASCGVLTQAANSPLWEEIKSRGYQISENLEHDPDRAGVEMRTIYNIRHVLNSLGVLKNKHIPDSYLLASYEDRLDLLRGLMDTDGYFHPKRKRFVMTTSFDWLMQGMKQLLSSLGCKVSVFREIHKYNGKEFPGWNINFTTNKFNPFLVRNQEIEQVSFSDNNSFRNIESIEEVETVPTQCIAVDSPSHTYLAGDSLIVTHNTNKEIKQKGYFDNKSKTVLKMKYPLNNLEDCNFNHYQLQLSTYAWMLLKINPDFVIKDLILNHYDHAGKNTLYHCKYMKEEVIRMLAYYKKQLIHEMQKAKLKPILY